MKTCEAIIAKTLPAPKHRPVESQQKKALLDYYEIAGPDYEAWSKEFNMHFGYYEWGMNPFDREKMLNHMNRKVLEALQLPANHFNYLLDLGCGLGASARYIARTTDFNHISGLTIVPWQVKQARKLNRQADLHDKINILLGNHTAMPFGNNFADGCYAIESACYASGLSKSDLIREIYRVLRPGGRMVITDGLLKHPERLKGLAGIAYPKLLEYWVVDTFGEVHAVEEAFREAGFKDVCVEEHSWHVAPSVAHIPIVVLKFLLQEMIGGTRKMGRERWNNVKGPIFGMLMGMCRNDFGYYMISATKPA